MQRCLAHARPSSSPIPLFCRYQPSMPIPPAGSLSRRRLCAVSPDWLARHTPGRFPDPTSGDPCLTRRVGLAAVAEHNARRAVDRCCTVQYSTVQLECARVLKYVPLVAVLYLVQPTILACFVDARTRELVSLPPRWAQQPPRRRPRTGSWNPNCPPVQQGKAPSRLSAPGLHRRPLCGVPQFVALASLRFGVKEARTESRRDRLAVVAVSSEAKARSTCRL